MNPTALVQRLYNYCTVLRDDGVSTIEYVEQLTFLLFLKMADELAKPPFQQTPRSSRTGWTGSRYWTATVTRSRSTTGTSSPSSASVPGCWGPSTGKRRTRSRIPPSCARS